MLPGRCRGAAGMFHLHLGRLTRAICLWSAMSLVAAGCAGGSHIAAAAAPRAHVRIGLLNAIDCAATYIARERGYFADQGLDVDIIMLGNSQAVVDAARSGAIDVGFLDYVTFFRNMAVRQDMHVNADAYQIGPETQPLIALPGSGVRSPRDLAGKRISTLALGNIQMLLTNELVKAYGVDPKTLRFVSVPFQDMGAALKSGQVDVVSDIEPFNTEIEAADGAQVVADMDTGATRNVPIAGYVSTESWRSAHRAAFDGVRRALQRASVDAAQRSTVEHVVVTYNKIDPHVAALMKIGVFPTSVSAARLRRVVDLMRESKIINGPIDLPRMTS